MAPHTAGECLSVSSGRWWRHNRCKNKTAGWKSGRDGIRIHSISSDLHKGCAHVFQRHVTCAVLWFAVLDVAMTIG